jgi:hypothetical protein
MCLSVTKITSATHLVEVQVEVSAPAVSPHNVSQEMSKKLLQRVNDTPHSTSSLLESLCHNLYHMPHPPCGSPG